MLFSASEIDEDMIFDDSMVPPPPIFDDYHYDAPEYAPPVAMIETTDKKYSKIERSELQLLHRMINHPHVLKRILSDGDFQFMHKRYQDLFDEFKHMDEVSETQLLSQITGEKQQTIYEILSSVNVPEEVTDQEIDDLLTNFLEASKGSKILSLQEQLKKAKETGNKALELQLTLQIIAQTQQDGV